MKNNYPSKNVSNYKEELNRLASEGTIKIYTDEENLKIIQELNSGLEDFLLQQRTAQIASELELKTIWVD